MATPCSVKAYGAARRSPTQLEVTICDFKFFELPWAQLEHEVGGKALDVLLDRLHQRPGFDLVEIGEVGAQHDLVAAEHEAGAFDPLGGNCGHRRRLPRYHAHVCRTDSLSADHVPFERCANARIVRDCSGWMQLI